MIASPFDALIAQTSQMYGLPYELLKAQCEHESSYDPFAFRWEAHFFDRYIRGNSKASAAAYGPFAACSVGLMQIMVETAYEIGFDGRPEQLFDPRVGLAWGAKRMKVLWSAAGGTTSDYAAALAAYNGGPAMLHVPQSSWPMDVRQYVTTVYTIAGRPYGS